MGLECAFHLEFHTKDRIDVLSGDCAKCLSRGVTAPIRYTFVSACIAEPVTRQPVPKGASGSKPFEKFPVETCIDLVAKGSVGYGGSKHVRSSIVDQRYLARIRSCIKCCNGRPPKPGGFVVVVVGPVAVPMAGLKQPHRKPLLENLSAHAKLPNRLRFAAAA